MNVDVALMLSENERRCSLDVMKVELVQDKHAANGILFNVILDDLPVFRVYKTKATRRSKYRPTILYKHIINQTNG